MTAAARDELLWTWQTSLWERVIHCDARAVALADRHYSRQTPGSYQFTPPGQKLVLWHDCGACQAVWAVVHNLAPGSGGTRQWRCAMFRREGAGHIASDLIADATIATRAWWPTRYGRAPELPLTTEVDPAKVRRKRDPGRCFRKAGWRVRPGLSRGLVVLEAP